MSETEKSGFIKRASMKTGGYVYRRFGNPFISKVGKDSVTTGFDRAKEVILPKKADPEDIKAGYKGRYEDGGIARFKQLMAQKNVKDSDLQEMSSFHKKTSYVFFSGAAFFLTIGLAKIIFSDGFTDVRDGAVTAFMSLVLIALGIRHDFMKFQVDQRRMAGFGEYLGMNNKKTGSTAVAKR